MSCFFRERQKEQIAHAITDALQHAISREIDQGSARMRSVIEAVNEDIKRELVTTLQEVRDSCVVIFFLPL